MATSNVFRKFFDDAAVFPPGNAPLDAAVKAHVRRAQSPIASSYIGPLVLPLNKVVEATKIAGNESLEISAVVSDDELVAFDAINRQLQQNAGNSSISSLELKVSTTVDEAIMKLSESEASNQDLAIFIELPQSQIRNESFELISDHGYRLKFRTGGIKPSLFPAATTLVDFLERAVKRDLQFKLTAGLHRALRYTDTNTGFEHFGFVNIAAATTALRSGEGAEQALDLLNSDSPSTLQPYSIDSKEWRRNFLSFGTCSVMEPAETLVDLDWFDPADLEAFRV